MNNNPRITHKDIAIKVGCDKSTVSLALRGSKRIRESTRKKIMREALELGYRADPALTMLARQRWSGHTTSAGCTLAYLVNRRHSFYTAVQQPYLAGVRARAHERGFEFLEFDLDAYPSGIAASRVLFNRGIRGLIFSCITPEGFQPGRALEWDKFTMVSLSHGWGHVPVDSVGVDFFGRTRMVWHEVARRGYRRVGAALLREDPVSIVDSITLGASHVAQQELYSGEERLPFLLAPFWDRDAFLEWVRRYEPDAIISRRNRVHYEWLCEAGYCIPDDLGFASLVAEPNGGLSGARWLVNDVGRAAVDYVISEMHENQWGLPAIRQTVELDPEWVEGRTLPDRSSAGHRENGEFTPTDSNAEAQASACAVG